MPTLAALEGLWRGKHLGACSSWRRGSAARRAEDVAEHAGHRVWHHRRAALLRAPCLAPPALRSGRHARDVTVRAWRTFSPDGRRRNCTTRLPNCAARRARHVLRLSRARCRNCRPQRCRHFCRSRWCPAISPSMEQPDYDPFRTAVEVPQWRRQWALWRAARRYSRADAPADAADVGEHRLGDLVLAHDDQRRAVAHQMLRSPPRNASARGCAGCGLMRRACSTTCPPSKASGTATSRQRAPAEIGGRDAPRGSAGIAADRLDALRLQAIGRRQNRSRSPAAASSPRQAWAK